MLLVVGATARRDVARTGRARHSRRPVPGPASLGHAATVGMGCRWFVRRWQEWMSGEGEARGGGVEASSRTRDGRFAAERVDDRFRGTDLVRYGVGRVEEREEMGEDGGCVGRIRWIDGQGSTMDERGGRYSGGIRRGWHRSRQAAARSRRPTIRGGGRESGRESMGGASGGRTSASDERMGDHGKAISGQTTAGRREGRGAHRQDEESGAVATISSATDGSGG